MLRGVDFHFMWHLQVQMKPNKSILESSSIVNLMISNGLSQNMEELFKIERKNTA